jgi:hypothetical protein
MASQHLNCGEDEVRAQLLESGASNGSHQARSKKALVADNEQTVAETSKETVEAQSCELSLL